MKKVFLLLLMVVAVTASAQTKKVSILGDSYSTFQGIIPAIGMMTVVDAADADKAVKLIEAAGEKAYIIGEIKAGEKGITLC